MPWNVQYLGMHTVGSAGKGAVGMDEINLQHSPNPCQNQADPLSKCSGLTKSSQKKIKGEKDETKTEGIPGHLVLILL